MASFLNDPNARQQALYQGLLMAGPALLAAASPSTQPGGLGRGFAAFGQNLGQGYRTGVNDARTGAMADIQMQMLKEKMAEQERARKAMESLYPQAQTPQTSQANFDAPPSAVTGQPAEAPSLMSGSKGIMPRILQGLPAQEALKLLATSELKPPDTEIGKLIGARDALSQNDPRRGLFDTAINKLMTGEGFRYGPSGMTPVPGGPADPGYLAQSEFAKSSAGAAAKFPYAPPIALQPGAGAAYPPNSAWLAPPAPTVMPQGYRPSAFGGQERESIFGATPVADQGYRATPVAEQSGEAIIKGGPNVIQQPQRALEPGTRTEIQKKQFDANEGFARLANIAQSYKPEYQTIGTKLDNYWAAGKEKINPALLNEQDKKGLADFSNFKRQSLDNLNRYIKEITGAQMSIQEADRIKAGLPDPGTGLIDGDSPTQFQSKLQGTMRDLKLAKARYHYILNNGMNENMIGNIGLSSMQGIINERGKALESAMKQNTPNADEPAIQTRVKLQLAKEFGLEI